MVEEKQARAGDLRSPVVSVVMPAYRAAQYIEEALKSIFGQTFGNWEVIVVNDGSPDTPELEVVLERYQSQLIYIKQQNRGPSAARNAGMRCARGQYLAFLDSDDVWLPTFLEVLVQFLQERPAIDMVCADCIYFGDTKWDGRSWQSLHPISEPITFDKLLPTHGGAFPSFVLLRKDIASKVGFFEEELRILEDYQYWLRFLYGGGKMAYVPVILGKRRIHPTSLTYGQSVVLATAAQALESLKQYLSPASQEAVLVEQEIRFVRARNAIAQGRGRLESRDYEGARDCFSKANQAVPSKKLRLVLAALRWFPRSTRWTISRWDQYAGVRPM